MVPAMPEPRSFLRYAGVGALATATHYIALVGGVEFAHLQPPWAAAVGALAGAAVSYGGNRTYAFRRTSVPHHRALPRFALVALAVAVLSAATVSVGTALGLPYLLAQMIASLGVLLVGFALNRSWTFA